MSVLRVKANGHFVLHPMGTFGGYGGYVGINPCRELPSHIDSGSLGMAVIELLGLSGSTGYHLRDIEQYRKETLDAETARIRGRYFARIRSTGDTARRFLQAEVSKDGREKSWRVIRLSYVQDKKVLRPNLTIRVRLADGPEALGRTLLELLEAV